MSTAVLNPEPLAPVRILRPPAGLCFALRSHQRDLCHADSASGQRRWTFSLRYRWRPRSSFFSPRCRFAAPSNLSVFPTLLLLLTLFRLALNIASSRRILLHGSEGTAAAGRVIEAFGQFVVGGNYIVGFVLFLALVAIQFLVVSHGAVRTAEVTARFTLDALPGKQMAIDADMNAGLIDEAEARRRRQAIAREAEFYGAMDGAARFNQRDSMATILITAINIVAGLLIGTLQQGIELGEAARTYTVLTVGDGLVTLMPSLLVSVAGGITLTRANSAGMLGTEIRQQLFARPATLYLASVVCAAMCLIPGPARR